MVNSDLFSADRLPHKPYCGYNKTASNILPLAVALKFPYIQFNPPAMMYWMVFDIDEPGATAFGSDMADWREIPTPNIIIGNPRNGHAHYCYALSSPVCMTGKGRRAPQRYAEAIYASLAYRMGADPCFNRGVSKNPLHPMHATTWMRNEPYELHELGEYLDANAELAWQRLRSGRNHDLGSQKGRNCQLFDDLRKWAYEGVKQYLGGSYDGWKSACRNQAEFFNQFSGHPEGNLPAPEVRSISRSVAKAVWNWYDGHCPATPAFRERQQRRGALKGAKRRTELQAPAIKMAEAGHSQRAIANELGVSQKTIHNWLTASRCKGISHRIANRASANKLV